MKFIRTTTVEFEIDDKVLELIKEWADDCDEELTIEFIEKSLSDTPTDDLFYCFNADMDYDNELVEIDEKLLDEFNAK